MALATCTALGWNPGLAMVSAACATMSVAAAYGGAGNLQPTAQATRFHSGAALVVRSACAFAYPSLAVRGALTSAVTAARSSAMAVTQSLKSVDMRASIDAECT